MKGLLPLLATILFAGYFLYILPAFSYSKQFFVSKYNPTDKELMIIHDVYEKMYLPTRLSLWIIIAMYVLFMILYFINKRSWSKVVRVGGIFYILPVKQQSDL